VVDQQSAFLTGERERLFQYLGSLWSHLCHDHLTFSFYP
jgi:hypothetical protein